MLLTAACALAALAWLGVLAHPRQPHRTRERLEAVAADGGADGGAALSLTDVTVLIPARNEAAVIGRTLAALTHQGPDLEIVVIDDESMDDTAEICRRVATGGRSGFSRDSSSSTREESRRKPLLPLDATPVPRVIVITGQALPPGWGGKLWALEQGLGRVERPWTLLLDADIELAPGVIAALLRRAEEGGAALVSVMATLRCVTFWERLLVPPFIFFFKLLYPFAATADPRSRVAGAAGGCMLARTAALREVGAFGSLRDALIDDCTLARKLKDRGLPVRLGLSRSVRSHRAYPALADFWRMITRTAYTQLRYSIALLVAVTLLMVVVFLVPLATLLMGIALLLPLDTAVPAPDATNVALAAAAVLAMSTAYRPVVRFYELPAPWVLTLPCAALLFLAMTWGSAVRYWRGTRATWKSRTYKTHRGQRPRDAGEGWGER